MKYYKCVLCKKTEWCVDNTCLFVDVDGDIETRHVEVVPRICPYGGSHAGFEEITKKEFLACLGVQEHED